MNSGYQVIKGTANSDDNSGAAVAPKKGAVPATIPVPMPTIKASASAAAISAMVKRSARK
jgi:hypothetical protein